MKKKLVTLLGLTMLAISVAACGASKTDSSSENGASKAETSQNGSDAKNQNGSDAENQNGSQDANNGSSQGESNDGSNEGKSDSFGLKDFDGLYCNNFTENFDGYDITYTYGYQLNADGTGVYYGQDTISITWNETELHVGDNVYTYDMEPGKLTVHEDQNTDNSYNKKEGKFIKPNPYKVDLNNVEDGIYSVAFKAANLKESNDKYTLPVTLYTEDTYDIVDIGQLAAGDTILVDGFLYVVDTVNTLDSGLKDINGGIEEGGTSLRPVDESNCYVFAGYNDIVSYTNQGDAELTLSPDVVLNDSTDPSNSKKCTGADAINTLKKMPEDDYVSYYNTKICVENGVVVEINRTYMP